MIFDLWKIESARINNGKILLFRLQNLPHNDESLESLSTCNIYTLLFVSTLFFLQKKQTI